MMTPFSQVSHLLLVHNVCGSSHATMHRKETKEVAFVFVAKTGADHTSFLYKNALTVN